MNQRKTFLSIALAAALAATGGFAAEAEHDQHHPGAAPPAAAGNPSASPGMPMAGMPGGGAGNMPMMGMMQMMMGQNGMAGHVEGRIAFLKAELKITDAQQPLWNAVAEAIRSNAKDMAGMPHGMAMMGGSAILPERLAAHEKMMAAHLDRLRRLRTSFDPLYAALSPDQKKTADGLMIGPMGVMGMGMM
jgi:LTXXQ motif family protein